MHKEWTDIFEFFVNYAMLTYISTNAIIGYNKGTEQQPHTKFRHKKER